MPAATETGRALDEGGELCPPSSSPSYIATLPLRLDPYLSTEVRSPDSVRPLPPPLPELFVRPLLPLPPSGANVT